MTELNTGDLEEMAGLIRVRVDYWQAAIPYGRRRPLGERSAAAIKTGHEAVQDIDRLIARLHEVRAQLVSELRQDEDIRMERG